MRRQLIVLGIAFLGFAVFSTMPGITAEQAGYDEDEYGPQEKIIWNTPAKGVFFDHKIHTMDVGLDCESCHDELFEMEAGVAEEEDDFTMAAMIDDGQYCGACHYEDGDAFSVETNCTACHMVSDDMIIWSEPVKGVVFNHSLHTEDFDCADCHSGAFAMMNGAASENGDFTMTAMDNERKYCGLCHHEDGDAYPAKTRCTSCHIGVKGVERLTGIGTADSKEDAGHE